MPLNTIEYLLAETIRLGGWLIFYTHDVSPRPSKYGCIPDYFERVVELSTESGAMIPPVGEIVDALI
mgnify:CR=1 FL=1